MRISNSKRSKSVGAFHFTDDLVLEIIARLPTKSLRRFQCVSKSWRGFISDVSSRREPLLPMAGLFFFIQPLPSPVHGYYAPISNPHRDDKDYCCAFESRLTKLPFYSTTVLIHSCNGLLLFTTRKYYGGPSSHFVWNPTTGEIVALPERSKNRGYRMCFLAFDPRESPHYKVVCFTLGGRLRTAVEIYSSISGKWVDIIFRECPVPMHAWNYMSVFHKGALYMLTHWNNLVLFDVERTTFELLSLPEERDPLSTAPACIGESRGRLYYAANLFSRRELGIWMFDEGSDEQWLLKHKMSFKVLDKHPLIRDVALKNRPHSLEICPIAFHPDSEVIYLSIPSSILAYHPSSKRLEEIFPVTDDCVGIVNWMRVFTVIPCLESIDPPGGTFIRR